MTELLFKNFELDLQEVKLAYLNWALDYLKEPDRKYRHLFLWDDQESFCLVNSRYGRTFSLSPFGVGVRGVPRPKSDGLPRGIDEIDMELKDRLTKSMGRIRETIRNSLSKGDIEEARNCILDFFMLKIGFHELMYDRVQYQRNPTTGMVTKKKGRWGLDESEKWHSLTGIRNRIINVVRYGEDLEDEYVRNLDAKLPGFSRNSNNTFLSAAMTWNRYSMCAFDTGPVMWSKSGRNTHNGFESNGFVHFKTVKQRMKKVNWPYQSTARKLLKPLYRIALDYRRPPIRIKVEPNEGYSMKSMRKRREVLYETIDNLLDEINRIRAAMKKTKNRNL